MKFFVLIFVLFCGVQLISTTSVEPKANDASLPNATVIDQITQLIQEAIVNLTTQTEQFIQKLQENLENLVKTADEALENYGNATAKQVNDLIGDSVSSLNKFIKFLKINSF